MVQVAAWHSIKKTDRPIYHNNTRCTEGNNIERENRRAGTSNRPLCEHCARLNRQGQ